MQTIRFYIAYNAFSSTAGTVAGANTVYAGPATGAATLPTFRSLVRADLPFTGTPDGTKFLRDDLVWATPAGGGTIGGTIASTQVAFGTSSNTIGGNANFTFNSNVLTVNGVRFLQMPGVTTNSGLAIGNSAGVTGTWATSQGRNTGVGFSVLSSLINGSFTYESSYNSAFGYQVLKSLTIGTKNTGFGYNVLNAPTTQGSNSGFGANVLSGASLTGYANSGFGADVLTNVTTGYENSAFGNSVLGQLTTGYRNFAFGGLHQVTSGIGNTTIGSETWEKLTTQSYNVGVGFWSGVYGLGSYNTAIGAFSFGQAANLSTSINSSVAVGASAGDDGGLGAATVNGIGLLFLGAGTGYKTATDGLSYAMAIGSGTRVGQSNSMVFGSDTAPFIVNYGFGGESYGGGSGVLFFKNATTATTSAPTNGFIIESISGVGYIRNAGASKLPILGNPMTTTGDIILGGASGVAARLGIGTSGYVLTSDGTTASWVASASGFADPMTTRGDIIYRNSSNVTARLGLGTSGQFLSSNGSDLIWATGSGWSLSGTSTLTGANTIAATSTNTIDFQAASLGATASDVITFSNPTAAAAGAQQWSPFTRWRARGWKTAATAASQTVDFDAGVVPVQGAAAPTGDWYLRYSVNGGAYAVAMQVNTNLNGIGIAFNNGATVLSGTTNSLLVMSGNSTVRSGSSSSLQLQHNNTSVIPSSTFGISLKNLNAAMTYTSGTAHEVAMASGFAPTSGTGVYNAVTTNPTINQTGGANGDVTILNIIPTITSAGDDLDGIKYSPTISAIAGRHNVLNASAGGIIMAGAVSPTQLTADQNDYNPTDFHKQFVIRLSSDASRSITGIAAPTAGEYKVILNVGAQDIVLVDESASSTAANRFALNANITIGADEACTIWYDGTSSRWRVLQN